MPLKPFEKPFDLAVMVAAICAVAVSFFTVYGASGGRLFVNIKSEHNEWVFPADAAETVTVSGPLGETVVSVGAGAARIVSSPCPNGDCAAAGEIRSSGQWTACLPNRVMVVISEGEGAPDVDAAAY